MANNVVLACGSIHQGNRRFSADSRGRQCIFFSLAGLICHHAEMPMNTWNSRTIDKIVVQGDAMYRNALAAVAEFPMQKLCRLMIYQLQLAGPVKL